MRNVEYKSHGLPLQAYELTRHDHRWQKDLENIQRAAHEQVAKHLDEVYADPVRAVAHHERLSKVWKRIKSAKTPPHEIMRWRVRLYCGHVATTSCHAENDKPPRSTTCPRVRQKPLGDRCVRADRPRWRTSPRPNRDTNGAKQAQPSGAGTAHRPPGGGE
ncbi:hypothetical protein PUR49_16155 [Streptomyces sp. BE147]|uniref:hypothetical protein n=1 Tax=Streptomyces sp. BE147 TaxID=3002524 RepID=UPI002E7A425B|nr:hypothetical protein [Streptomyces sp. BE147]MEE1738024.1 hypothetical protein [Streptomyces sp. BE147]